MASNRNEPVAELFSARTWLGITALVCVFGVAAEPAGAQRAPGLQVLEVPSGQPLECSNLPVRPGTATTGASRAVVARRFLIPRVPDANVPPGLPPLPQRELVVMWDTAGRPRVLTDRASPRLSDVTSVMVTFSPNGAARGRRALIAIDSARVEAALRSGDLATAREVRMLRPPVTRDLTPTEAEQARELAKWLWPRRCAAAR